MLCVEPRRQGQAQGDAAEDRRAYCVLFGVFQEDRVPSGQPRPDLLGQDQSNQGLHQQLSNRLRKESMAPQKALLGQRLPEQKTNRELPQAHSIPRADQGCSQQRTAVILLLLRGDAAVEAGTEQEKSRADIRGIQLGYRESGSFDYSRSAGG